MSYQVLARKWRPSQFAEVVGQQHVLKPLEHALDKQRLHHAYLFTGTRGVGKTTIARILAKALNCEEGITATPCGKCSACLEIEQGRFVDLLEIDAASRTKVEDTRELLDNVQYRPTRGRYKVYLIDEVHMLSRHSFNALLKTLEEPPEHVKFLLATTDPQKLPVTILSRCLQFNLKALSNDDITQQLSYVLSQEQVQADSEALPLLARSARGSMRDALSLTDQAIAQGGGSVSIDSVRRMLGNVPVADIAALLESVLEGDAEAVMQRVDSMVSMVPDLSSVLVELQSLLHQLALVQQVPSAANVFENSDVLKPLLRRMPAELIQVFYRTVLEGRREQAYAIDARSGLEMTLLRLLCFRPAEKGDYNITEPDSSAVDMPESKLTAPAQEVTETEAGSVAEVTPQAGPEPQPEAELSEPMQPSYSEHEEPPEFNYSEPDDDAGFYHNDAPPYHMEEAAKSEPVPEPTADQTAEPTPEPAAQSSSGVADLLRVREQLAEKKNPDNSNKTLNSQTENSSPVALTVPAEAEPEAHPEHQPESKDELNEELPELNDDIREAAEVDKWSAMIAGMDISGLARQVLLNSELQKLGDDDWLILVAEEQKSLLNESTSQAVRESLAGLLGATARVEFKVGVPSQPTPLMVQQHINEYRHQRACEILHGDAGVQDLQQRFQAQIDESSIQAR
ncbi:UNVERIFIED_ORG: DNA polymerase III gamma subunit /DNA polymerase III tau subunit [Idiomarina abyssalis]|uniref:DNA polymerase III subunit gamma/tau n=2 Tax=Idiomarina TaxID=135575 RepID=UPI000C49A88D|nr:MULTISPECIES: DNA polymerase III subunit gamma/tau [unclassified Idiomarina]MAA61854.1 DNA polymerase III subunit gamma/tau [Idiomarina sp.]TDO49557.1 DNA polymerase III gamma subunit /DNA polymerase III tau subunit [Idiomarina sp. 017G]|tara:strand:- start:3488 stop:5533 length:2046 start_codon:yes stop_codon:yes gene_type:complete